MSYLGCCGAYEDNTNTSKMKTVYLVRHGESEGNVGHFGQSAQTPLTDRGRGQARRIAERTKQLEFDILVCSHYTRAQETAAAISEATGHDLIVNELFGERRRASHVIGLPHQHPDSLTEVERWWRTWGHEDPSSDAESYPQLTNRARQAWHWLADRPEDIAVVVTHDFTSRMLLAYATLQDEITPAACRQFIQKYHLGNTGLAGFKHVSDQNGDHWQILFWNDQSHLAE